MTWGTTGLYQFTLDICLDKQARVFFFFFFLQPIFMKLTVLVEESGIIQG